MNQDQCKRCKTKPPTYHCDKCYNYYCDECANIKDDSCDHGTYDNIYRGYLLTGSKMDTEGKTRLHTLSKVLQGNVLILRGENEAAIIFFRRNISDDLTLEQAKEIIGTTKITTAYPTITTMFGIIDVDDNLKKNKK